MVRKLLMFTALALLLTSAVYAIPIQTAEYGAVPVREFSPAQDQCHLSYYNFCSGWLFFWSGYCYGTFIDQALVQMGTCFDLSDCPGDCRHLDYVYWGLKCFNGRGYANIEIYCADEQCCPVGAPLAGIYGYNVYSSTPWHRFDFGQVPLCPCEELGFSKFIVMLIAETGLEMQHWTVSSDINSWNIDAGCETAWRCSGHSYVYQNAVSYCDIYGTPGPMWVTGAGYGCTNYPAIPPGCHNYLHNTGFHTEFLVDVYISCLGATETEGTSWGEVKRLYR